MKRATRPVPLLGRDVTALHDGVDLGEASGQHRCSVLLKRAGPCEHQEFRPAGVSKEHTHPGLKVRIPVEEVHDIPALCWSMNSRGWGILEPVVVRGHRAREVRWKKKWGTSYVTCGACGLP